MNVIESIKAARRCGTPLIIIRTADPQATMEGIKAAYNGTAPPMLKWDLVRGAAAFNNAGGEALQEMLAKLEMEQSSTTNPTEFLNACGLVKSGQPALAEKTSFQKHAGRKPAGMAPALP